MTETPLWHVSEDCKATLLLCHEFGGRRLADDAKPLTIWEYGQLVRFLKELERRPHDLLHAETADPILSRLPVDLPADRVRSLLARGLSLSLSLETWRSRGIWVISRADSRYPSRLKDRFKLEAPPVLFGVGTPTFLNNGGLGVFGSRNVDEEGENYSKNLGRRCAKENITVLSGCARGVDWASMSGCLEEGGRSIGVIAEKLDRSAVSSQYREFIKQERLVLISMFAPEAPFTAAHAKGRDKYTYSLSDYGVVVSAEADKGGTWAGATEQLKRLRHVPVLVRSEGNLPTGNPLLLSMGAKGIPKLEKIETLKDFLNGNQSLSATRVETPSNEKRAPSPNTLDHPDFFSLTVSEPENKQLVQSKQKFKKRDTLPAHQELARQALELININLGSTASIADAAKLLGTSEGQILLWKDLHSEINGKFNEPK
jgi:predicted Rossmann fold nucleotide-binding protein DprA/Smf involved in DNA uptake